MSKVTMNSSSSLAVETYGNPNDPAIIFFHGAGVSSWMWTEQIEDLKSSFYCITVDLPGSGDSFRTEWQSFEDTVGKLAEIIRHQVPDGKAHIVGLSLGGYTALYLLANHSEVVNSVIVSGITTQPFPRQWLYRPLMSIIGLVSKWDVMIRLNAKMMNLPDEIIPMYRRDSKRTSSLMFRRIYNTLFEFTIPEKLYSLPNRVLAVAGDKEVAMITQGLQNFNALPNSTTCLVPNAHHGWNGEHPALFTAMIRAWVTNQPLPEELLSGEVPSSQNLNSAK